jgi:hypothetical protein
MPLPGISASSLSIEGEGPSSHALVIPGDEIILDLVFPSI